LVISEKKQQAMIGMVIEALIDPVPGFKCYGLVSSTIPYNLHATKIGQVNTGGRNHGHQ